VFYLRVLRAQALKNTRHRYELSFSKKYNYRKFRLLFYWRKIEVLATCGLGGNNLERSFQYVHAPNLRMYNNRWLIRVEDLTRQRRGSIMNSV
jgi:hypothetical protein